MEMPANQGITNRAASDRSVPKDLIELLRLAKLQRDQQAAARAQALNAPQTPTVKEQLEEATGIARMAQGGMVPGYADGGLAELANLDEENLSKKDFEFLSDVKDKLDAGEITEDRALKLLETSAEQTMQYDFPNKEFDRDKARETLPFNVIDAEKFDPDAAKKLLKGSANNTGDDFRFFNAGTGAKSKEAPVEVDKILDEVVEGKKKLGDEVSPTDMDSLIQSILNPAPMGDYAEDNKFEPESQSKLQTLADFLIGGANTSNIGTTLANAAGNMSAEADKDEAKQRVADKDAYDKAKNDRADTLARKSLAVDSNLKQAKIDADEAVKLATVNATYMPAAIAAVTKIETALNEAFNLAIQQNSTMADLRAAVRSGDKSPNDPEYQKAASEFMDNFNTTNATSLESLKRSAEKIGLPVSKIGLQGINSGGLNSPSTGQSSDLIAAIDKYKTI